MLIGQHIALKRLTTDQDYVGIICTRAKIHDVIQDAVDNARFICEDFYGLFQAPEVKVYCPTSLEFMYPHVLIHVLT
jgi:pyruvate dehydrogenase kinase 2/3/4